MVSNGNSNNSPKDIDWKKKGLGWIPDYPDIRDYKLDKTEIQISGRLRREEVTSAIENLANRLIETLNIIQKFNPPQPDEISTLLRNLEESVFGNISFVTVKAHKLLRVQPPQLETSSSLLLNNDPTSKELLLQVKSCLYVLLNQGCLEEGLEGCSQEEEDSIARLKNNPKEAIVWLRREKFDKITENLVKAFQHCYGIKIDGIVGLEVYNALETCFSICSNSFSTCDDQKSRPCKINNSDKQPGFYLQENFDIKLISVPAVQLITASSLIPSEAVSAIFDNLIHKTAEQIQIELIEMKPKWLGLNEKLDNIFETSFFNDATNPTEPVYEELSFKNLIASTVEVIRDSQSLKQKEDFKVSLSEALRQDLEALLVDASHYTEKDVWDKSLMKIMMNEFSAIEPIIAVVLKTISPLAVKDTSVQPGQRNNYKSLDEAIQTGLKRFEQLFILNPSNAQLFSSQGISKELAEEAIQEVYKKIKDNLILLKGDITHLIQDNERLKGIEKSTLSKIQLQEIEREGKKIEARLKENSGTLKTTLFFYFLLYKFTKLYSQGYIEKQQRSRSTQFNKQVLLEIEDVSVLSTVESNAQVAGVPLTPLFSTAKLQIPVSKNLSNIQGLKYLDKRTRVYLFLPSVVDLSYWCTPIEDQGTLQSCAAFSGIALIEYFVHRSLGKYTDVSPLFLYKATRNLMDVAGDVGGSLRETMKAMALFGVPPEEYWRYEESNVDQEPPAFCYSYAQNYQALKYFRLDYAGIARDTLLLQIKAVLAAGFPCMFGFTIYTSAYETSNIERGYIPLPNAKKDKVVGGHAVVAVGYDDYKLIECSDISQESSRGALLIRNSWGADWGKGGYGWLPYDYVIYGLTRDWWSLLKAEWFENDSIGLGASSSTGNDFRTNQ